ncbi:MAG: bifunctional homocysteine S-methyltransferase/methylenetetrahydrofolate reductase [Lachnospiraceae bacterium]|nr:bifunctional homocysteine S-methyltransferase/methylenetetrahydrofolate reductase [Lachnospiraceae bacterium]
MEIKQYLMQNRLLTDGAMGTYFDEVESENYLCSEEANLLNPDLILKIHQEYIEQGARLIRSNTFSSNRKTFEQIQNKRAELKNVSFQAFVAAGYEIALRAGEEAAKDGKEVYVAADIGPIFEERDTEAEDVLAEYYELCDIFLEQGARIFVLETFPDEQYVIRMARYIKEKAEDVFIIAQFSFVPTGYSRTGYHYKTVLTKAVESGCLDAVGLNCGIGAAHMEKFYISYLEACGMPEGVYLTALPNCGYPQIVRGRAIYSDSVSYFGKKVASLAKLGVKILGGCCGTTPEYIGEIAKVLTSEAPKEGKNDTQPKVITVQEKKRTVIKKDKVDKNPIINHFREKLEKGETVYAVELDPPFDADAQKMITGAELLKESPVDIITIADSPLARSRADSLLMAAKIRHVTGMDVMPHLCCRDRNRIGIRSGILGAQINDIRNFLIVTGDPVGRDERAFTKSVFDFNSIKMMKFLQGMNEEIFKNDPIFYGGALNQNGSNPEKIAERMKKKMDAGCSFFLTQPVYSEEELQRLSWLKEQTGAKILIGIMPLVSYRNALFIKNEMPGIYVPDQILEQYVPEGSREEWEAIAIRISKEIMQAGKEIGAGYYFMTPFQRVSLIQKIIR